MPEASSAKYQANIRMDLRSISSLLQGRLQHLINLVAYCHSGLDEKHPNEFQLPGIGVDMRLSSDPEVWSPETTRSSLLAWITRSAVRDAIEEFSHYLEKVREACGIWTLVAESGAGAISGEDWNRKLISEHRRFHGIGLPAKLEFLTNTYNLSLSEEKYRLVMSINHARNCLVHRDGFVGPRDLPLTSDQLSAALQSRRDQHPTERWSTAQMIEAINDAGLEASLTVSWLRLEVFVQKHSGEEEILRVERVAVDPGESVGVRFVESRKEFELGRAVLFDPRQFVDIAFTLVAAAQELRANLEVLGRSLGIPFEEATDSEPAVPEDSHE